LLVSVDCDARCGVSKKLLYSFHLLALLPQETRQGMSERVPGYALGYSGLGCCRLDVVLQSRLGPIWTLSVREWGRKDPIAVLVVRRMITPDEQGCCQCRQHLHSLSGCSRLHFCLILRDVTTLKIEPAGMKVEVGPFEAAHFAPTKCGCSSCGNHNLNCWLLNVVDDGTYLVKRQNVRVVLANRALPNRCDRIQLAVEP